MFPTSAPAMGMLHPSPTHAVPLSSPYLVRHASRCVLPPPGNHHHLLPRRPPSSPAPWVPLRSRPVKGTHRCRERSSSASRSRIGGLPSRIRRKVLTVDQKKPSEANDGEMASAAAWEGPTAAELKVAGAEVIPGGVRVKGWVIQSHKGPSSTTPLCNTLKMNFKQHIYLRWFLERVSCPFNIFKLASNCISMPLMQSRDGKRRHCHRLRFLLQQIGSSEDPWILRMLEEDNGALVTSCDCSYPIFICCAKTC